MSAITSLGKVTLRPSQRLPEHAEGADSISTNPYHRIEFRHPAYPADYDVFLTLPALDHPSGGLHFDTAKVACGVVAGNRWDGHFEQNGQVIDMDDDDILPCGAYFFFLPGYSYGEDESLICRRSLTHIKE
jgi:hypothetical protein